jgi:hypothetical protein
VPGKIIAAFSRWSRRRKARWIVDYARRHGVESVLVVGVGRLGESKPTEGWENLVERLVERAAKWFVASGLAPEPPVPGWAYVAADGLALPFRDGAFDLVVSNAVLEHVGDEEAQRRFIAEHARVGRHWIATTPNRWFPVESHTGALFVHWTRRWQAEHARKVRLLSRGELVDMLPPGAAVRGRWWNAALWVFSPEVAAPVTALSAWRAGARPGGAGSA